MKHMKILFPGLLALALHNNVWAEQVYETTNAQGNAVFTDSPQLEGAKAIDLQQPNIADTPQGPAAQQPMTQPQAGATQQEPVQESTPVVIDNNAYDELEQGASRRQRALEAADPQAPDEVGDSLGQMPDEVGDFDAPPEVENIDGGEPQYIDGAQDQRTHEVRRRAHAK